MGSNRCKLELHLQQTQLTNRRWCPLLNPYDLQQQLSSPVELSTPQYSTAPTPQATAERTTAPTERYRYLNQMHQHHLHTARYFPERSPQKKQPLPNPPAPGASTAPPAPALKQSKQLLMPTQQNLRNLQRLSEPALETPAD